MTARWFAFAGHIPVPGDASEVFDFLRQLGRALRRVEMRLDGTSVTWLCPSREELAGLLIMTRALVHMAAEDDEAIEDNLRRIIADFDWSDQGCD